MSPDGKSAIVSPLGHNNCDVVMARPIDIAKALLVPLVP